MGKKRAREADGLAERQDPAADRIEEDDSDDDDDDDDDDMEILNVDFELFNYDPEIDFHGVKTLLRQLFDMDATLLDLSALSDLIVRQNTIGSTCKVDDKANDAYAFLTVLKAQIRPAGDKSIAQLVEYLVEKARTSGDEKLAGVVPDLLRAPADSDTQVGLVLADRLINMPTEIVPPMWKMMIEEIEAAVEDGEPYKFTHYLVVSRTYEEVESNLDQDKRRNKKAKEEAGTFYFHPEDEELRKHATVAGSFAYTKDGEAVADSKRAFQEMGIKSKGFMMLIEAGKFEGAVHAMAEYVGAPS